MLHTVGALLVDGLAMFEFGVVCEVFGIERMDDGVPPFDFRIGAATPSVSAAVGVQVQVTHDLAALANVDLLTVPATTIRTGDYDERALDTIRAAYARGTRLLSVCSGVFVLAAAGVLDGHTVTTHWRHADLLAELYPELHVDPDVLFVDDGQVVTSAGTAAGIDACLHVVRQEHGAAVANAIARRMVVPPQRDGGQRQYIVTPVPECDDDALRDVLAWTTENLAEPHTVSSLARRALTSPRTFARRFVEQTGTTPARWLTAQRVQHARALLEETDRDLESIATLCGFGSAALLRHHFRAAVGVPPADYRTTFARR
ncbi:MAG: helix-turn-helix domain-containing protein [Actinobacteria bacterium]|nr:helix-turn-helix domain-containing protein [Actinomycetota bacterium]MCG2802693.1 helix-turn-helix domain-containing protein [Cellulomonas sp.]